MSSEGRHTIPIEDGKPQGVLAITTGFYEFVIRTEVVRPIEIVRSATTIGAKVLRQEGRLGCLRPGALADIIVVDGNPLADMALLGDQGRHLSVIMKGERFHKRRLG